MPPARTTLLSFSLLLASACGGAPPHTTLTPPAASRSHETIAAPPAVVSYAPPASTFRRQAHFANGHLWVLTSLGLVRVDRDGNETLMLSPPEYLYPIELLRAHNTLLVMWTDLMGRESVDVVDATTATHRRLADNVDGLVEATADGAWLAFRQERGIYLARADGVGGARRITDARPGPLSLGKDARHIAIGTTVYDREGNVRWSPPARKGARGATDIGNFSYTIGGNRNSDRILVWKDRDLFVYGDEKVLRLIDLETNTEHVASADCIDADQYDEVDLATTTMVRKCERGQLLIDLDKLLHHTDKKPMQATRIKGHDFVELRDGVVYLRPPRPKTSLTHLAIDVRSGARTELADIPAHDLGHGFSISPNGHAELCTLRGPLPDLTTSSHLACKTEVDDGRMLLWRNTALSLIDMRTPRELLRYGDVEEIPASYKVQARADGERFSADTEALDPFTDSLHYVIENHVPYTSTFVPRGADAPADPALDAFLASLSTLGVCAPIGADASGAIVVRCRQHMTRYVRVVRADGAYRVEGPPRPLATHYNGSVRTDSKLGGYVVVEQAHDDPISGWLWQRHLWALLDPTSLEPQLWILFGWDYALVTDGVRYQRLGNVEHAAAFLRCKYPDGTLKPYATCANDASLF